MILFTSPAFAVDCAPLDEGDVRIQIAEAKEAVDRDDLVGFAQTRRDLFTDLPCLEDPLPVDAWARFLLDDAVVSFALGEPWEATLSTALTLAPELPRTDLPPELRDWVVPARRGPSGALVEGDFLLDGLPLAGVPELAGLHVVQRQVDGVYSTRVLRDEGFPAEWRAAAPVAPAVVERRRRGPLVATGVAMAVAGAGLGAGTWAARGSVTEASAADRLVAMNVVGWSVAGVGLVVGGVGFALPVRF